VITASQACQGTEMSGATPVPLASEFSRAYEEEFARLVGVAHATAFAYARHGLISSLAAVGLQRGDEVILSPLTCKVVPLALLSLGLKPVYVDVCLSTLNLDPERVAAAMRPATRAVLFQHTYGNSAGIAEVAEHAAARGVVLIEDCAQCTPHRAHGRMPGMWGQAAVFSNNLRKPLPAGSGGVAVTNDDRVAERIRGCRDALPCRGVVSEAMLRLEMWLHRHVLRPQLYWPLYELHRTFRGRRVPQSVTDEIEAEIRQLAQRPSDYQMQVGLRWLTETDAIVAYRRLCFAEYTAALVQVEGLSLPCKRSLDPLYYFPVLVRHKDGVLRAAKRQRLEVVAWPMRTPIYPVERDDELARYGYRLGSAPVAEEVARRLVGLPTDVAAQASQRGAIVRLLATQHGCAH
jgi:dTDP-4-amino-4,6-dideoxygalactose transaminase